MTPAPTAPGTSRGRSRVLAAAVAATLGLSAPRAGATPPLPVPCAPGACGTQGPSSWLGSGSASLVQSGSSMTITQNSASALLNWSNFNIGAGGQVTFKQPGTNSVALNQIYQANPSQIFGSLNANGQVYLINPNGFVFGSTATVNVAGLVASSLNISGTAAQSGILSPKLLNNGLPAFVSDGRTTVLDLSGQPVLGPDGQPMPIQIVVEPGAQISTNATGGRVLLASSTVTNGGTISTPDGQTILAAGQQLFIQASSDPALRGLLVEVDGGGTATNLASGVLSADRGNITMLGLAVNQMGRASATTSVASNGSVRLLARDTVTLTGIAGAYAFQATNGGSVTLGPGSVTQVLPELASTTTALDAQPQLASSVELSGRQITLAAGAAVVAPGGTFSAITFESPTLLPGSVDPQAQIRIDDGAVIDVSGASASVPMSRNLVTTQLRGTELADDPLLRNGPLEGQTVIVDSRVGTPLANVSAALANTERTVGERLSTGGTVTIESAGDLVLATGSKINVSGGAVNYQGGVIQTTQLVTATGNTVDIGQASPNQLYVGVINPTVSTSYSPWGVTLVTPTPGGGHYEPGYVQGSSAGTVTLAAPSMIVNGSLLGSVQSGPYQRTPATMPTGGSLVIGLAGGQGLSLPNYSAPSVDFTDAPSNVVVAPGTPLPSPQTLDLPVQFLTEGGFSQLRLYSNGTVRLPAGLPLELPAGGEFEVTARAVDVDSSITVPGGTISLTATPAAIVDSTSVAGVFIGPNVSLDVRGEWINDFLQPYGVRPVEPAIINGGGITLDVTTLGGTLALGDGDALHATGGGSVSAKGAITGGTGGSITLDSQANGIVAVGQGVSLDAFGVLGAKGGSFALDAGRVVVANDTTALLPGTADATLAVAPPGGVQPGSTPVVVGSAIFSADGFNTVALRAEGAPLPGGTTASLEVLPGTTVTAVASTLQPVPGAELVPSAANVSAFTAPTLRTPNLQVPMSVSLAVGSSGADPATLAIGTASIDAGAVLAGGPQSSFSIASPGGVVVEGAIDAPGGSVTLGVGNRAASLDVPYSPGLRIVVAPGATIDVAGEAVMTPNQQGLLTGTVLNGGSITMTADRGGIEIDQGATLDLQGGSAPLDLRAQNSGTNAQYSRQTIGGAGGSLSLSAPEFIDLLGTVRAGAGASSTVAPPGGTLSVVLSRNAGFSAAPEQLAGYPSNPREIDLSQNPTPPVIGQDGQALVSASAIDAAGFGAVRLGADRVSVAAGTSLSLSESLTLDAPVIAVSGTGTASLSAPVMSLQNTLLASAGAPATSGTGSLELSGDYVQFGGNLVVQGTSTVSVRASGDLVFQGFYTGGPSAGSLGIAGGLSLATPRAYAASETAFTITAAGGTANSVTISQLGASPGVPLSAGGALTINADTIAQNGTLLQPFGTITLNATGSLTLAPGSVTSVSGGGATIPFGTVQNSSSWIYGAVVPVAVTGAPAKRIGLSGSSVTVASGATVDSSGGGDLYAYDWIPGTGGTKDVLAGTTYFAVLSSERNGYAPYDPSWYAGTGLTPGASIYLSGVPGLPAGVYPILPARYALLSGGYLVSAVGGFTDLQPGTPASLPGGIPIVSGYYTFGDTGLGNARTSGFAVTPGGYGHQLAEYDDYSAASFFPAVAAQAGALASVPADGGTITVSGNTALSLAGALRTANAAGGQGGEIDIAAPSLTITGNSAASGATTLSDTVLDGWAPGRLLLGGVSSPDHSSLSVAASTVTFADGAHVTAPGLTVVASTEIAIEPGAVLATPGTGTVAAQTAAPASVALPAGTAFLALSDAAPAIPVRAGGGAGGATLELASGASLSTHGALSVDAPGGVGLDGTLAVGSAQLELGSGTIVLGSPAATPAPGTLTLTPATLAQAAGASALDLTAGKAIQFEGSTTLGVSTHGAPVYTSLTLASPLVSASPGVAVLLGGSEVTIAGAAGPLAPATLAGGGGSTLTVNAGTAILGPGSVAIQGFDSVAVNATGLVMPTGTGSFAVSGNLTLSGSALAPASGANVSIDAGGNTLTIGAAPGTAAPAGLGARLALTGGSVAIDGTILAPSSLVQVTSAGDLTVSGAVDVSGTGVLAGGRTAYSPGGTVSLDAAGALTLASGSRLAADGPAGAAAGTILVTSGGRASVGGSLSAQGPGGALQVEAGSVADFGQLVAAARAGGFVDQFTVHVGSGDLALGANTTVTSRVVDWSTDSGSISVLGTIDAAAAPTRGSIALNASGNVTLGAGAVLDVDAPTSGSGGGAVVLGTTAGAIDVTPGSLISAQGGTPGTVLVRAPAVGNDVAITELAGAIRGAPSVTVEPFTATVASGPQGDADLANALANAQAFASAAAPGIAARLATAGGPAIVVAPGVELDATGPLALTGVDLSAYQSAGAPIDLMVRSTGTLTLSGQFSDGFGPGAIGNSDLLPGPSARFGFVAGANLAAANPLATGGAPADLVLAPGAMIRTGTGSVSLAASEDVRLGAGSAVYTGGTTALATSIPEDGVARSFASGGGSVWVNAGRDVIAAPTNGSITDWLLRVGADATTTTGATPTQWGVNYDAFNWRIGTFGGGDVTVSAGRDVHDLSTAVADSGNAAVIGATPTLYGGGGSLRISAGGDADSIVAYDASGYAAVAAGGAIGSDRVTQTRQPLGAVLMMGSGRTVVTGRTGVQVSAVINPFVLGQPSEPQADRSYFVTYGSTGAFQATALGGTLSFNEDANAVLADTSVASARTAMQSGLTLAPPSLRLAAFGGDVQMLGSTRLFASDNGQLDVFASRDITTPTGSAILTMSDAFPGAIPDATTPSSSGGTGVAGIVTTASSGRHVHDPTPAVITAGRDILGLQIGLPKPLVLTAGRDLIGDPVSVQQFGPNDTSTLTAGRDLVMPPGDTSVGITVGGPGTLQVITGRNLDLGFSTGITTVGATLNPNLPSASGANVELLVGMGPNGPDIGGYLSAIVANDAASRAALIAYVGQHSGTTPATYAAALADFQALPQDAQLPFVIGDFFSQLVQSGRAANSTPGVGFRQGYAAIDALWPGSREASAGTPSTYGGDLGLPFSRIYTLQGGAIQAVVPNGVINVGLANPPTGTSLTRQPSQLGIVTEGPGDVDLYALDNVLVNQSRVFTLLGGNILIWSTLGNIDAGRGSKSAISAPPPTISIDASGNVVINFGAAVAGSGIRTIDTDPTVPPGNVDLIAPVGFVNAGDAGIGSAGNLNIAAQRVLGLDNIQVGGTAVGVPPEVSNIGVSVAAAASSGTSASSAAAASLAAGGEAASSQTPLAQNALSWLDVFVVGLGEDSCKPDDLECLKRQKPAR